MNPMNTGIITAPGKQVAIAMFIAGSKVSLEKREQIMAQVATTVWMSNKTGAMSK